MIAAAVLLLQLGAASAPAQLLVRGDGREAVVPVVSTTTGPAVRADLVVAALGGTIRALPNDHHALTLPGVAFDVAEQVHFTRTGTGEVLPLAGAPFRADGRLYVPFQLVAEHLPARGSGVIYDARLGELRLFSASGGSRASAGGTVFGRAPVPPATARPPAASGSRASRPADRDGDGDAPARLRGRRRVVVDAGHGGPDGGMHGPIGGGPQIRESSITLAVSRRLAQKLRDRGIDVVMTRTTDTLIALGDRGRLANASRADLFLSIHVNAANMGWKTPGAARGFETFFLAEAQTEDARRVERMENEAVRFETAASSTRGDPLGFIINDMAQNEHLRESSDLAAAIQGGLARVHPGPDRGVKQANFAVLRTSFMPAVLVELGFGTNREEAMLLADSREQERLAAAIAEATVAYLARYERRVGPGTSR